MRYMLTMSVVKSVDDWNATEGVKGRNRDLDFQQDHSTVEAADPEILGQAIRIRAAAFVARQGLDFQAFTYWIDEPGRFTTNQIEDRAGDVVKDDTTYPHDMYLADYDLRIDCVPLGEPISVGTFGLQSIDGA
jgi:hypothetical protein